LHYLLAESRVFRCKPVPGGSPLAANSGPEKFPSYPHGNRVNTIDQIGFFIVIVLIVWLWVETK
jgi:hypothetical protein